LIHHDGAHGFLPGAASNPEGVTLSLPRRGGPPQGPGQTANEHRKAGPRPDWPALPELGRVQPQL